MTLHSPQQPLSPASVCLETKLADCQRGRSHILHVFMWLLKSLEWRIKALRLADVAGACQRCSSSQSKHNELELGETWVMSVSPARARVSWSDSMNKLPLKLPRNLELPLQGWRWEFSHDISNLAVQMGKNNLSFYAVHWPNFAFFPFLFYLFILAHKDRLGISECHQSFQSDSPHLVWQTAAVMSTWPSAGSDKTFNPGRLSHDETLVQVVVSVKLRKMKNSFTHRIT